jgi:hypothetical protein
MKKNKVMILTIYMNTVYRCIDILYFILSLDIYVWLRIGIIPLIHRCFETFYLSFFFDTYTPAKNSQFRHPEIGTKKEPKNGRKIYDFTPRSM